ncbi:sensor histidine kinase [Streptomyces sp. CMB-StM0423]|uniref:sensor histidine kinase n=1 Tax=Streptomyces sp. CMB-StM0423 TaxID=2059884 RepID=UPI000C6FF6D0|nr:sensor histidine kinase [Streptomyces sp. CMB-StM0423]AUH42928.1 two-component sensor histidine kinase [Streptomyces sp. CMB-StM0423]
MLPRPRRGDPLWIWLLHGWDVFSWAIIGLLTLTTLLGDVPAGDRYGSLALLAVLALGYAAVRRGHGNTVRLASGYLVVLIVVVGLLSWLRDGFGVLYTVTLSQFVIFANTPRSAIVHSGLGALAITLGGSLRQGWSVDSLATNATSSVAVYAVGVVMALVTPRAVAARDERVRLRSRLADAEEQLTEAQKRQGAAEERERIAREIHDTLAQGFASIVVLAEAARAGLAAEPEKSAQQLQSIERTARENLAEARVLVGAAPRSGVAAGSVATTLRRTLDRFAEDTGLAVEAELPDVHCDQPTRIALLRCTQESLANVRKHAEASTVGVVLAAGPEGVELEITDDGKGFVPGTVGRGAAGGREGTVPDGAVPDGGFGLDGMRRRLAEFGGELSVTSSPGDGTRILITVPAAGPTADGTLPDGAPAGTSTDGTCTTGIATDGQV